MRLTVTFLLLFFAQTLAKPQNCNADENNIYMLYTRCHTFKTLTIYGDTPATVDIPLKPLTIERGGTLRIENTEYLEKLKLGNISVAGAYVIIMNNRRLAELGNFLDLNEAKNVTFVNNSLLDTTEIRKNFSSLKEDIPAFEPCTFQGTSPPDQYCVNFEGNVVINKSFDFNWSHIRRIRGSLILGDVDKGNNYPELSDLEEITGSDGIGVVFRRDCPLSDLTILLNVKINGTIEVEDNEWMCHTDKTRNDPQLANIELNCPEDNSFIIATCVTAFVDLALAGLIVFLFLRLRKLKSHKQAVPKVVDTPTPTRTTAKTTPTAGTPRNEPKLDIAKQDQADESHNKSACDSPPKQQKDVDEKETAEGGLFTGQNDMMIIGDDDNTSAKAKAKKKSSIAKGKKSKSKSSDVKTSKSKSHHSKAAKRGSNVKEKKGSAAKKA